MLGTKRGREELKTAQNYWIRVDSCDFGRQKPRLLRRLKRLTEVRFRRQV